MSAARSLGGTLLGSQAVERLVLGVTGGALRVVTYHRVPDAGWFAAHLAHLRHRYQPVSAAAVRAAFGAAHTPLPQRAVWLTFDDGDPSVIEVAQPLLDRHGISATMFVCPGVVDTTEPLWWEVVLAAAALGIAPRDGGADRDGATTVTRLKKVPDGARRAVVAELAAAVAERRGGRPLHRPQVTIAQLRGWLAAGHSIGNHSWDHPCLDRCDADEQRRQVASADQWLASRLPTSSRLFAYPNGNWAPAAEAELRARGYDLALLFDHRLASIRRDPLRVSRLNVAAGARFTDFRARLSGAHALARQSRGAEEVRRRVQVRTRLRWPARRQRRSARAVERPRR